MKNHYDCRNSKIVDEVFLKSKGIKKFFFRYIKKKQKNVNSIGPFIKKNKVIEGTAANILMKQYQSVYTVPRSDLIINDWNEFFINKKKCIECEKEWTHIFSEDTYTKEFQNCSQYLSGIYRY